MLDKQGEKNQPIDWFLTSFGQVILSEEKLCSTKLIPSRHYPCCLQVGLHIINFLEYIKTYRRCVVDTTFFKTKYRHLVYHHAEGTQVIYRTAAISSALPFAKQSHDLIILPHTLDFCDDPHVVLRQVRKILRPEGCVCIIGFNPISFYGLIRIFRKFNIQVPWNGKIYHVSRVQDWLQLLEFDLVGAEMFAYKPPFQNKIWSNKFNFFEKIGNRWLSGLGGIYVIVGRKYETATIHISPCKTDNGTYLFSRFLRPTSH